MGHTSGHAPATNQPPAHAAGHAAEAQHHPTWQTYVWVGLLLTFITAVEVSAYYIPAWETSPIYVPSMLILSAIKFAVVVLVYMHLKYDHKIFRALFTGPFVVSIITIIGLLFLFGQLSIQVGGAG